jgi:hypothetical protein
LKLVNFKLPNDLSALGGLSFSSYARLGMQAPELSFASPLGSRISPYSASPTPHTINISRESIMISQSQEQTASSGNIEFDTDEPSLLQNFWESTHISCGSNESICGPFFLDTENTETKAKYERFYTSNVEPMHSNNIDPFNHDMVGPKSCEYCGSSSTRSCDPFDTKIDKQTGQLLPVCTRPKLYFLKKRPPFDNDDRQWDPTTEYSIKDKQV